jgi:hypothetical protein
MRTRKIRTKARLGRNPARVTVGGYLNGEYTYLWLGDDKGCMGWIDGNRLYRLAKAIVRQFEAS